MYKRRIASIGSQTKIYHYSDCYYAKRILRSISWKNRSMIWKRTTFDHAGIATR